MAEDWSVLPVELLAAIVMKMETWEDFVYFSVVCRWWNYASVLIKQEWRPTTMPWLLLAENNEENPSRTRKIFNLSNNKSYNFSLPETFGTRCLGSAYGWIVLVQRDFNVLLFNPITKARILFPSLEPMIQYVEPDFDKNDEEDIIWFLSYFVSKLAVLKVARDDQFAVVMVLGYRVLSFATHGDQTWTLLTLVPGNYPIVAMVDVVAMDDHVFAMYEDGAIKYWNVMELCGLVGVKPMDYCPGTPEKFEKAKDGGNKQYLVQSGSDLLMVRRYKIEVMNSEGTEYDDDIPYKTVSFKVYRCDNKDKSWVEIDELGDVALFVGNNSSMCVSGALAKGLQHRIYFSDDESQWWTLPKESGGYDMGVYDLKSGAITRFYEGDDTRSSFCPSTWLFI